MSPQQFDTNYNCYFTNNNDNIRRLTKDLESLGIRVKNIKVVNTTSDLIINPPRSVPEFTCLLSEQAAHYVINLKDDAEVLDKQLGQTQIMYEIQRDKYSELTTKINNLNKVLKNNPAINDQWDEMMTMLKMAGFDDTI
jgi:hypothetical protein